MVDANSNPLYSMTYENITAGRPAVMIENSVQHHRTHQTARLHVSAMNSAAQRGTFYALETWERGVDQWGEYEAAGVYVGALRVGVFTVRLSEGVK